MIICAAIRIDKEIVIGCIRHGHGLAAVRSLNPDIGLTRIEQGFLTNECVFLNRIDAFEHALKCGQLSATAIHMKQDRNETELYSEDLY